MGDANRWIAPVIGLPEPPFVDFGDALFRLDQAHVTAHHPGPGLLHRVNPRIGLREDDFRTLARFAEAL